MTNIVLLTRDRLRLTEQCLRTLYEHTPENSFNLTVVDDASGPETREVLRRYERHSNCQVVYMAKPISIVGYLRNLGVWTSERVFGRGEYLYFSDNDIAFKQNWLEVIQDRLQFGERHGVLLLGGYCHPFHGRVAGAFATALSEGEGVLLTDAVAGYSHLMSWSTWDCFGPFDQHAKGVCQSEDFAFSQKIKQAKAGIKGGSFRAPFNVGYVTPPVIVNCGLTNSEGKPAIGAAEFPILPGLIYE